MYHLFYNALVHVIYSVVSGQYSSTIAMHVVRNTTLLCIECFTYESMRPTFVYKLMEPSFYLLTLKIQIRLTIHMSV